MLGSRGAFFNEVAREEFLEDKGLEEVTGSGCSLGTVMH